MPITLPAHLEAPRSSFYMALFENESGQTRLGIRHFDDAGETHRDIGVHPEDLPVLTDALQRVYKALLAKDPILLEADRRRVSLMTEVSKRADTLREAHLKGVPLNDLVLRHDISLEQVIQELRAQNLVVDENYLYWPRKYSKRRKSKRRKR